MVKIVLFAVLLVVATVSAQYGHGSSSSSYGHGGGSSYGHGGGSSYGHGGSSYGHGSGGYGGHAESFQNFHLEVGHQVPVQIPVYHSQPSHGYHQSSHSSHY